MAWDSLKLFRHLLFLHVTPLIRLGRIKAAKPACSAALVGRARCRCGRISRHPSITACTHVVTRAQLARPRRRQEIKPEYDLCFPVIDLYRNRIDHRNSLDVVA